MKSRCKLSGSEYPVSNGTKPQSQIQTSKEKKKKKKLDPSANPGKLKDF